MSFGYTRCGHVENLVFYEVEWTGYEHQMLVLLIKHFNIMKFTNKHFCDYESNFETKEILRPYNASLQSETIISV